jgi:protease-4
MLGFLKNVFATIVGLFLFFLFGFFILIGIAAAIGGSEDKTALKENTVLKLDLNHPIVENVAEDENPLKNLGGPFADNSDEIGLVQIREALKACGCRYTYQRDFAPSTLSNGWICSITRN